MRRRIGSGVVAEFAASLGEVLGEVFEGREARVDDGLVGERPQPFGGLEFGGVGRQEEEDEALGRFDLLGDVPAGTCQPALSSTKMIILSVPAPSSRTKASRVFWKASMLTVLKRYQTTSPELGSTKP